MTGRMAEYAVVIPAHNAAPYVAEAVRSALAQTVPPREVIVVDDGSADETASVAAGAGARVLVNGGRAGASAARNLGVAATEAPIIAFLDADDVWGANHAATCLAAFAREGEVVSFSRTQTFGTPDRIIWPRIAAGVVFDPIAALVVDNIVQQSAVFVSRAAVLAVGGYDESLSMSEDYDLWLRLSERCAFVHAAAVTVDRRIHDGQTTHGRAADMRAAAWGIRRRFLHRLSRAARARCVPALDRAITDELDATLRETGMAGIASVRAVARILDVEHRTGWHFEGVVLRALPLQLARFIARNVAGAVRPGRVSAPAGQSAAPATARRAA